MVHVPKIMTQTRVRHEHVEQTVEVPIPQTQEPKSAGPWSSRETLEETMEFVPTWVWVKI